MRVKYTLTGWSLVVTLALLTSACTGGRAPTGASATLAPMTEVTAITEASRATALPIASPSPYATDGGTPMPTHQPATRDTPIRVIIGDTVLTGRLWDNATARDLIAHLPLTLTFRDFNGVETIAQLPRKLSMDGVPAGDNASPRDIGYYNPSGDLVF